MSDVHEQLYRIAEGQAGYFTAGQAVEAGMDRATLRHHARPPGRYERVQRGLYRLRHFPSSAHEHVVAAWLPFRRAGAIVSHASALDLYGITDVIPTDVHLSVSRAKRGLRPRAGVRVHTLERPLNASEVREVVGIDVTTPERALVEALEDGVQPEQIELGIGQALDRGLTTSRRLRRPIGPGFALPLNTPSYDDSREVLEHVRQTHPAQHLERNEEEWAIVTKSVTLAKSDWITGHGQPTSVTGRLGLRACRLAACPWTRGGHLRRRC